MALSKGNINHKGSFYEMLRRILKADKELETIVVRKKLFLKVASDTKEYARNVIPTDNFIFLFRITFALCKINRRKNY
jgi:hypothetical protein